MTATRNCETAIFPKANVRLGARAVAASGMLFAIDFPGLQDGQFAICSIEYSDGNSFSSASQPEPVAHRWQVIDSYEVAHHLAVQNVIIRPNSECVIYDSEGQQVHAVRNGQPIPLETLLASRAKSKNWWQFWRA